MRKAKVGPLPFLFVCVFLANAASFVLPIPNPANLVDFHGAMPSLGRWLGALALPSVLTIATTYVVLRIVFHRERRERPGEGVAVEPLPTHGRWVFRAGALVMPSTLAASILGLLATGALVGGAP